MGFAGLQKPPALQPGSCIGVVAPASPAEPAQIEAGAAALQGMGFRVRLAPHAARACGYLAGTDRDRASDLNALFADPQVDGIVCLRGGYGSMRILEDLDYGVIRRHPKVFVGYSDITALHLALQRHARLVTFHGPMAASGWAPGGGRSPAEAAEAAFNRRWFLRALTSTTPLGTLDLDGCSQMQVVSGGKAQGAIVGGNLSLIASTLGTPYEIDVSGAILFFEDVGEAPYRIDRMLTQLRLAGILQAAAGIVVGECVDCQSPSGNSQGKGGAEVSLLDVLHDRLGDLGIPVLYGLPAGHGRRKLTLPLGVRAELDADRRLLTILEAGVR
ncbi:MAG: LD-carboxypeptidase [Firmicutes bacterium]|nr:LD-carboxypeptidase [Bacillota bacterium]